MYYVLLAIGDVKNGVRFGVCGMMKTKDPLPGELALNEVKGGQGVVNQE